MTALALVLVGLQPLWSRASNSINASQSIDNIADLFALFYFRFEICHQIQVFWSSKRDKPGLEDIGLQTQSAVLNIAGTSRIMYYTNDPSPNTLYCQTQPLGGIGSLL